MRETTTEPAEEWTGATEKRAVDGGDCTTLEVECGTAIVREVGVSVLEEGDQNEPVVDPEIRDTVDAGHLQETTGYRPIDKSSDPEENTNGADDNLVVLVRSENDRRRLEMVGHLRVVALTSSIADEIQRPPKELVGQGCQSENHLRDICKPTNCKAPVTAALIGESPSASHISTMTSFDTCSPVTSSRAESKGGNLSSERVFGTKTWSCVICPVAAWCLAWLVGGRVRKGGLARGGNHLIRQEWYGTPRLDGSHVKHVWGSQ